MKASMPLRKGSSVSLPSEGGAKDHPLKRKQPLSFDDRTVKGDPKLTGDLTKNRLIRSNDLLTQTTTEVLLDLLKAYAVVMTRIIFVSNESNRIIAFLQGVKECSEETQVHLYMVKIYSTLVRKMNKHHAYLFRFFWSFTHASKT